MFSIEESCASLIASVEAMGFAAEGYLLLGSLVILSLVFITYFTLGKIPISFLSSYKDA